MVKNLPANAETRDGGGVGGGVRSLDWEAPPEAGIATHSSILAWRISWIEKPGGLPSMGVTQSRTRLSE